MESFESLNYRSQAKKLKAKSKIKKKKLKPILISPDPVSSINNFQLVQKTPSIFPRIESPKRVVKMKLSFKKYIKDS